MDIIRRHAPLTVYRSESLHWSAIVGGWVVATAVAWLLYVLGLAVGFSSVNASHADAMVHAWGPGTRTWLVATWAVSLFMGALFASWIDGKADRTFGLLNGIAVWGLATTVGALLLSLGFSNALQGGSSLLLNTSSELHASVVASAAPAERPSQAEMKANAERLAQYTAGAMWALFFSSIAGAFAAGLGGWLGSGHLHRVYDSPIVPGGPS